MDTLLLQGLSAVRMPSVRAQVRSRLQVEGRRPARRIRRPNLRLAALLAPVALAAVLVALFLPQALHRNGAVTPAVAAWRLQRPHIAYPLAVDAAHPDHLLVGAWGQVYQSWNAGGSWAHLGALPSGLSIRDVAVDRSNPTHYLVAAKHSVYESGDRGRHWRLAVSGLQGAMNMFLMQSKRQAKTFYLGPGVIWTSADRGHTWHQDGIGRVFAPYGVQSLALAANGTLFAGIWGGGVAVSVNGGRTWQRRAAGLRKNVLDVAMGQHGRMWAATDRGTYRSSDGGQTWVKRSPRRVFSTSVLDGGSFILAGTSGGLYRSTDGGRHWTFSEEGLPLDPYVYSLLPVPGRPGWVYASLDGDGIFRSQDGGLHWQPAVNGLPIDRQESSPRSVLFIRNGVLWQTNGEGADPGSITVDADVRSAALSPDGVSAAYVAGDDGTWSVRVVCSGCLARTILSGSGAAPTRPHWSPSATRVAVVQGSTLYVADTTGGAVDWPLPAKAKLLGWDHSGKRMLLWNGATHRVEVRDALTGTRVSVWSGVYMRRPSLSADGRSIARTRQGRVWVRAVGSRWRRVPGTKGCRPGAWSSTGTNLLLACPGGSEMRTASGRLLARAPVPASAFWAPGSDRALLYFSRDGLWRWQSGTKPAEIVTDAQPPK
jgi:photosystem II stability/assembly factor-like uncharacterized protein